MKNLFVIAAFATLSTAVSAQTATKPSSTPRIDARKVNQQKRIANGVKTGALTPGETVKLEKQQQRIDKVEAKDKAKGPMTNGERKYLDKMQNNASKNIHAKKHNAKTAS